MESKIPQHVAIIMDGNGRWARQRGLPRTSGHKKGAEVVEQILEDADDIGIRYLTVYAFSTENWLRPVMEVSALMNLLRLYMKSAKSKCMKNNVCVRVIGDRSRLDADLVESIKQLEKDTASNTGMHFQIAINYGGRDELIRAFKKLMPAVREGRIREEDMDEALICGALDTCGLPDPDLMIRTCGEQRTSNFLLWQSAYTELYFTDVAWPDFNKDELLKAVEAYGRRDRRYGGLTEENGEAKK